MYKRDNLKGRGKNEEGIQGEKWRALCDYGTSGASGFCHVFLFCR